MTLPWIRKHLLELSTGLLCLVLLLYISGIPNILIFSERQEIYSYGPVSDKKPQHLFILFHGANYKGSDIIEDVMPYAYYFQDAVLIAAEGPKPGLYMPYSHSWFYRWFTKPEETDDKASEAIPYARDYIKHAMTHYNIPPERTVLVGFSQGATMALHTSLQMDQSFAAIVSFAGYIAGADIPDNPHLKNTAIFLAHGDKDKGISLKEYSKALQILQDHGYNVTGKIIRGAGHKLDGPMLESSILFLQNVLKDEKEEK